jgi:glycosyltransferase involved in cell wall biosynthesis
MSETAFRDSRRPHVALITNHGYAGARIPVGGAPDTGGQNLYVNALALALDQLGYRVTVFARGGFPFFGEKRIRSEPEYLSDHVRYVFVPGAGDTFIRKEDIAVALDEQLDWLERFVSREAEELGCEPWRLFEFINSHYWDGALLGLGLVQRWKDDVTAGWLADLLAGAVSGETLETMRNERHRRALGREPAFHLGWILLQGLSSTIPLDGRAHSAAARWVESRGLTSDQLARVRGDVEGAISRARELMAPALHELVAAEALGEAILRLLPDAKRDLDVALDRVDHHVWTPHSLGELKDDNFRDAEPSVRRELKLCERRSHEHAVCRDTRAFAATSLEIAEWLRTHYGIHPEKIFYFPPAVNARQFRRYGPDEVEETYRYLSRISGSEEQRLRDGLIVFETSRMDRTKRKDLLLEAFGRVARQFDNAFLFIGGGPENELFESLREQREADPVLQERAFLTGFIPDEHVGPLFSLADLYVSPSEMEGFGMSVSQAAAAATAVIATELTPFAVQYVPDDAIIVPAGDVKGFERAMLRLLTDDAERKERIKSLAIKGRMLSWEDQTTAFLSHLRARGFSVAQGGDP